MQKLYHPASDEVNLASVIIAVDMPAIMTRTIPNTKTVERFILCLASNIA